MERDWILFLFLGPLFIESLSETPLSVCVCVCLSALEANKGRRIEAREENCEFR